jgi:predicted phosphoribosyltransferase
MRFHDRSQAGQELARALRDLSGRSDVLVLGIPRGGVIVAAQVAAELRAPLDVCLTHKLGAPDNSELAIGALSETGQVALDQPLIAELGVSLKYIEAETERQRRELERRARLYRGDQPARQVAHRAVIVIDDGLATGSTMLASLKALNARAPSLLVAAVPVAPPSALHRLAPWADRVECLYSPQSFWSVGAFYDIFDQTSDAQVIEHLQLSSAE